MKLKKIISGFILQRVGLGLSTESDLPAKLFQDVWSESKNILGEPNFIAPQSVRVKMCGKNIIK